MRSCSVRAPLSDLGGADRSTVVLAGRGDRVRRGPARDGHPGDTGGTGYRTGPLGPLTVPLSTPLLTCDDALLGGLPLILVGVVSTGTLLESANHCSGGPPDLGIELYEEAALALPFQLPGLRILQRVDGPASDW